MHVSMFNRNLWDAAHGIAHCTVVHVHTGNYHIEPFFTVWAHGGLIGPS